MTIGAALPTSGVALNRVLALGLTLVVILGIAINQLQLSDDPYRCKALLNDGTWLNAPAENGSRAPFTNWQPPGCMIHKYKKEEIEECMEGRHMLFVGDSTTRQVFYGMARLLDAEKAEEVRANSKKHESHDVEFGGIRLKEIWDPFGNDSAIARNELTLYHEERINEVPVDKQKGPALAFMGMGVWFAARFEKEESIPMFKAAFNNMSELASNMDFEPFGNRPMDPRDGIGNEVFWAPIAPPFYDMLPDYRKTGVASQPGEVEEIDEFLKTQEQESGIPMLWSFPALSYDQQDAIGDHENGFHVTDSVAEMKAQILLNLRCNAKLDIQKSYPYDRTCCTDYGQKSFVQIILVTLGIFYVSGAAITEILALRSGEPPKWAIFNLDVATFVTGLLACYWADRTQSFAKGSKEYNMFDFNLMSALCFIVGFAFMTKSKPPPPRPGAAPAAAPATLDDAKPLSRDQTDEWKGWMQALILVYHWTGASRDLNIYVGIRLLVAAYLFQTGFGHGVFFSSKKDFSFKRVAAVLLRLNLLSCALPFFMNTDYMFYYFAPLVSFWFLIIYALFAIGQKYNDNTWALMGKIAVSAAICPGAMLYTPVLQWVFDVLNMVFRIEWDLHEWQFRLGLDGLIVYVGIIMGVASVRTKLYNKILTQSYGLAGVAGILSIPLYWWIAVSSAESKQDYTALHPVFSFIPIMGFIAARNMFPAARTWYSRTFAWIGRCSLETFTLQFHILLAADTKGLLLLDIFKGDGSLLCDRWRSLIIIVPVFLWISSRVADATGGMVKLLTKDWAAQEQEEQYDVEAKADAEPLMSGNMLSGFTRHMPSKSSWANNLKLRMLGLFVLLWTLNLFY
ncbi:o-acetyltransferase CAS1 [Fusarium pseudoanthophilum]|uniref:O-acetyltransferase CAS1 n=1 Tax=Fusarium pseudoanthophilum TaxID=48495 RepID=A0A8H5UXT4_9HYPO|nr:o-acetyltransferase CAS1 [Fusarium pseudoanthophilum]